jgi:hypothetical protein
LRSTLESLDFFSGAFPGGVLVPLDQDIPTTFVIETEEKLKSIYAVSKNIDENNRAQGSINQIKPVPGKKTI